jgi:hypothetical protein
VRFQFISSPIYFTVSVSVKYLKQNQNGVAVLDDRVQCEGLCIVDANVLELVFITPAYLSDLLNGRSVQPAIRHPLHMHKCQSRASHVAGVWTGVTELNLGCLIPSYGYLISIRSIKYIY